MILYKIFLFEGNIKIEEYKVTKETERRFYYKRDEFKSETFIDKRNINDFDGLVVYSFSIEEAKGAIKKYYNRKITETESVLKNFKHKKKILDDLFNEEI